MSSLPPRHDAVAHATFVILALSGALMLALDLPTSLAAVGLVGQDSLQGLMTFVGMWAALPMLGLGIACIAYSVLALIRGSRALRARVAVWWILLLAGFGLSSLMAPDVGFNPYLGSPQPAFSIRDLVVLTTIGASLVLPIVWLRRGIQNQFA